MGLVRFNENGSSDGSFLLHRMKPLPITTQLYGQGSTPGNFRVPVIRVGAGDKSFSAPANTSIILHTTASTGISTTTATITYNTYLTGSSIVASHLNSADQCLYILLYASPSWQFIKVSDTTGVVTTIGSSFTPTTSANWPTGQALYASMEVDSVSGHLKVYFNGFYHLVNKTTGAIVSQNTTITLGDFLARSVFYATQDGTVGVSTENPTGTDGASIALPSTIHSAYGHVSSYEIPQSSVGSVWGSASPQLLNSPSITLVDNDKVLLGRLSGENDVGVKYVLRTDFDKFVKSVAEFGAGVM